MVLVSTILQYLESNKRLVVPQFGAFIVKDVERKLLFSELLHTDDGVLRELLREEGMSEVEAAGEISRFVFEVRHALSTEGWCEVADLGLFTLKGNGSVGFEFKAIKEGEAVATEEQTKGVEPTEQSGQAEQATAEQEQQTEHGEVAEQTVAEAATEQTEQAEQAESTDTTEPSTPAENHISPSAHLNPDPSVKGLRYGRPYKNTDAYTYIYSRERNKKRVDRFVWIAVIAVVIALGAIAYGYFRGENSDEFAPEQIERVEQIEIIAPDTVGAQRSND